MENFPFVFDLSDFPSSNKVSKKFNSKEKQFVRNHLWLPVYDEVCRNATTIGNIKYLCFPGLGCNFIKQLLALGLISKAQTTIVAVEPDKFRHKSILTYFAETFTQRKYEVLEGNYEDLITDQRLIRWFMEKPCGFDLMELDFPVPLFSLDRNKKSKLLESIAKTMKLQAFLGKRFYLVAAFKAENPISEDMRTMHRDSTKMLGEKILQRENALLGNETLRLLIGEIDSEAPTQQAKDKCSLFAIPLAIIRRSEGICNVQLHDIPYTHISTSVGGTSRINSYIFDCQPRSYSIDCAGDTLHEETLKNMNAAISKTEKTRWVK